ncbi:MAG: ParA family protein [Candidatus Nanopelagicales bacterium]|jgi:chromosome partitioning protein|nr:ParA family protein [Candidatus Nanopelagicales bacterium]
MSNTEEEETPLASAAAAAVFVRRGLKGSFAKPKATRIITIVNQKGGVGKTTSAVNLAAAMGLAGLNVLVIDLDPQGNASTAFGIDHYEDASGSFDVLLDGASIAEMVSPAQGFDSLWVLPATLDLAGADIELITSVPELERPFLLKVALTQFLADHEMDYVFIDCPPSLGLLTINALAAVQEVLIPIQCEFYALEGVQQLLRTIEFVKERLNPELDVSTILLTMYNPSTNLSTSVVEEVRGYFGNKVLETVIPRSTYVAEAPSFGQSVMTYDPGSTGAVAYLAAAREITDRKWKG